MEAVQGVLMWPSNFKRMFGHYAGTSWEAIPVALSVGGRSHSKSVGDLGDTDETHLVCQLGGYPQTGIYY